MTQFDAILRALDAAGVRFVVVGGVAVALQGSSYRTQDLDIVYARDRENVERLVHAIAPLEPRLRTLDEPTGVPFRFDARSILNGLNFTLRTSAGDLDLFGEIAGIGDFDRAQRFAERISIVADSPPMLALTIEGLIVAKRAAGRVKDQLVLPELEAIAEIRALEAAGDEEPPVRPD